MRIVIDDDNTEEYLIFLDGFQVPEAFEADEETGRVWILDPSTFDGYRVFYGKVVVHKKAEPHKHTIKGVRINHGSDFVLATPLLVNTGDVVTINVSFTINGGLIESIQLVEADE